MTLISSDLNRICRCASQTYASKSEICPLFDQKLKSFCWYRCVILWGISRINNYLKHLINHQWQKTFNELIGNSNVRIVVNFKNPGSEVLVNEKVIPKKLELVFFGVFEKMFFGTIHSIDDQLFHPYNDFIHDQFSVFFILRFF